MQAVGARGHALGQPKNIVEVLGVAKAGLARDVGDQEVGVGQQ